MTDKKTKAKRVFDRYKKYDPSKGRGSAEEWKKKAARLLASKSELGEALQLLGLSKLPATMAELRTARKQAMFMAHPDKGGSDEDASRINEAFALLATQIKD